MSLTVIKEGEFLRIVEASEPIPDGVELVVYMADEILGSRRPAGLEAAQFASAFSDEDEDWGDSLDALVKSHG